MRLFATYACAVFGSSADPAGYKCEANMNYEGEKKCFGSCPSTNVATEADCAKQCDDYKKEKCNVFVYNDKLECYLKSDHTTSLPDDPSLATVSCEKDGSPTPAPGPSPGPAPGPAPSGNTIAADDAAISYIGRFDHKNPKAPVRDQITMICCR